MIHSDNSIYSLVNVDHNNNNNNNNNQIECTDSNIRSAKSKHNQYKQQASFHSQNVASMHNHNHNQQHEHDQDSSQVSPMVQLNGERNENLSRNQEQHRRLQYQVHQQLQKIYSNKLHEFEQHNQIQLQRQPVLAATNNTNSKHQSIKNTHNSNNDMINVHHHHNCLSSSNNAASNHLYQEQAYDSLSLSPQTEQPQNQRHLQNISLLQNNSNPEDFYDVQPNGRPSICAIPEECYEDEPMDPRHCQQHLHHQHDDDDLDEHDKEELLMSSSDELATPPTKARPPPVGSIDRKRQLESLHYATATAAALLNVTANAAAAFAAVHQQSKTSSSFSASNLRTKRPAYSETYQDIGQPKATQRAHTGPYQAIPTKYANHQRQVQRPPPNERPPIYATASDRHDFYQANRRLPRHPPAANQQQNQQQQQAQFNLLHQNSNNSKPLQSMYQMDPTKANMKPRMAPSNMLTAQQVELFRLRQRHMQILIQQQQQQQIQLHNQQAFMQQQPLQRLPPAVPVVDNMPTLAILHHGPKGTPLKVDLIARMPINPMVQQQQLNNQLHRQQQQQQQQQPTVAGSEQRLALANANPKARQGPIYGLIESGERLKQQLAIAGRPFIPIQAITSAPSDASGHSHVPLVMDRKLKRPGLLERICRIDLKLFWWSLIIVCGMFIAAVLTITRNVVPY